MDYLYHGSQFQNLKVLEPKKRYTPGDKIEFSAIYATPLPAYAAAHSFPWSSEEGVGLDVINEKISISIPKNLKDRLMKPISLYRVSGNGFEHTTEEATGYTWHATNSVPVLEEIKFASVEEALKQFGAFVEYV